MAEPPYCFQEVSVPRYVYITWELFNEEAARLGAFSPAAFRYLALADDALGRSLEAVAAARRAVELDRYDPQNQAVLNKVTSSW